MHDGIALPYDVRKGGRPKWKRPRMRMRMRMPQLYVRVGRTDSSVRGGNSPRTGEMVREENGGRRNSSCSNEDADGEDEGEGEGEARCLAPCKQVRPLQ